MVRAKKTILLDCDGVLVDFVGPALRALLDVGGPAMTPEQLRHYNFQDEFLDDEPRQRWRDIVFGEGFCAALPIFDGAVAAVAGLRELPEVAEVLCVTSPPRVSKTWQGERSEVLQSVFGFEHDQIIFASAKRHVDGDYLVDDSVSQVRSWVEHRNAVRAGNPRRSAALIARPYNDVDGAPASPHLWSAGAAQIRRTTLENFVARFAADCWDLT